VRPLRRLAPENSTYLVFGVELPDYVVLNNFPEHQTNEDDSEQRYPLTDAQEVHLRNTVQPDTEEDQQGTNKIKNQHLVSP